MPMVHCISVFALALALISSTALLAQSGKPWAASDTIRCRFTIDDPSAFTRTWTAEYPFLTAPGPIYEFACQEGNYALQDILAGARAKEREAEAPNKSLK